MKDAQTLYYQTMKAQGAPALDIGPSIGWDATWIVVDAFRKFGPSMTAAQLHDYIENLHGFVGINGIMDFSDGGQRGLIRELGIDRALGPVTENLASPMIRSVSTNQRLSQWNAHKLKLGFFAPNCSSVRSVTLLPDRWTGSWDQNLQLAQLADSVGIDFLLLDRPLERLRRRNRLPWNGAGDDHLGHGMSREHEDLVVFGTVHAPLFHPVVAAKQMVTADQVSHGRFGLNLVCGWNEGEFEMFGATLREHEQRYEFAQEWIDAVKAMWSDREDFDLSGEFFQLKGIRVKPKPYGGGLPIIMNAGASVKGKAFAVRNCDAYFTATSMDTLDAAAEKVADVRALARDQGREIGVFTTAEVYCAPTRREAEERFRHVCVENADWSAVEALMPMYGQKIDKSDPQFEETRRRFAHGLSGFLVTGTPDDVASVFAKVSAAGFDGVAFSFFDYVADLPYFAQEVLPRLARLGIRAPSPSQ